MNLENFVQIEPNCWAVRLKEKGEGLEGGKEGAMPPVRFYADKELLAAMDEKVKEQIINVSRLPGLKGYAFAMPDAHWGYGFPIGGVAAYDPEEGGIISAGGVGFDISCGIRCLKTDLTVEDISPYAKELSDLLFKNIPAGVGAEGNITLNEAELDEIMLNGAHYATSKGYGTKEDILYIEDSGKVSGADPSMVSISAKRRQKSEMGTLGSGNHYLEVQAVKQIFDENTAGVFGLKKNQIVISIHCGSRGLGHQVGTDYLITLAKAAAKYGINLPDRELACAPIKSVEGGMYLGAMNAAINVALCNRQMLAQLTRDAFEKIFPKAAIKTLFDVSHNTCKAEKHTVNGKELLLYVHRKGATRAFGPFHPSLPDIFKETGQPVIIGGSMGTGSYVLAGTKESEERSFSSASHGAGRAMSRNQALKLWRGREVIDELKEKGIIIRSRSMRGVVEEAPDAYKNVDAVAEATEKARLAKRVCYLSPVICIKG